MSDDNVNMSYGDLFEAEKIGNYPGLHGWKEEVIMYFI
jgi:hypothetical protein